MRPPMAHAGRTLRPTRVTLDRRLAGPTSGRTIGGCQCGGAASRMAALCAARGAAFRGARCAVAGAARRGAAGEARRGAAGGARRGAAGVARRVARRAADGPPAAHRPNGRVAAPEPDLGWTSGGVATRCAGRGHSSSRGSAKSRRGAATRGRDAPDNRVYGGDSRRPGGPRRPPRRRPPPAAPPRQQPHVRRVAAAGPPAGHPRFGARSAAGLHRERGATRRCGSATRPASPGHHTDAWRENLLWSRRVDRVLRTRRLPLRASGPA